MGLKRDKYLARLYPIDDSHPDWSDDVVYSDLSGEEITDKELWELSDGEICSEEEMIEAFYEYCLTEVKEEDYEFAKMEMISDGSHTEEDFKGHPTIYWNEDHEIYVLLEDVKGKEKDLIPEDWHPVLIDDLDYDDYDDEPPYYDF